ncbi:MAG: hypothetical protein IPG92_04145 [Flavobacteriales bacterium]|nr:hypothetical protein [Flavobacteriales bacterium]
MLTSANTHQERRVVGASCDDGLICTINDVYGANCTCAGTPLNDADGDGVCDENDLCTGTPTGELVNTDGCSCTQQTLDDGDPCTLDGCTDGIVSHTLLDGDADLDGVCDGADACANTPTGEAVNAFGCACSEQTVDDGIACTVDDCLNGVVTHILIDADADGVCDTDDACPGTAIGEVVSAAGCACAQLPTVCFDGACAAGPVVVGVNGPYSNVGASVQTGEPQPPTGSLQQPVGLVQWSSAEPLGVVQFRGPTFREDQFELRHHQYVGQPDRPLERTGLQRTAHRRRGTGRGQR